MKEKLWIIMCFAVLIFLIGFTTSYLIEKSKDSTQVRVYGVWTSDIEKLEGYEGTFICVNVDTTKTLDELRRTCEHEAGHEIFARFCEEDFDKCLEATR